MRHAMRTDEKQTPNHWHTAKEQTVENKSCCFSFLLFLLFFFFCFASPSVVFGVVSVSILPCPAIHYDCYNMHATCLNRFVMSLRCAADTIFLCVFPCCCLLLLCLSVCVCLCAAGVAACRFFCCCLLPFLSKTLFLFINKHSARFLHIAIDADINIIRCKCHASAPNATQWRTKKWTPVATLSEASRTTISKLLSTQPNKVIHCFRSFYVSLPTQLVLFRLIRATWHNELLRAFSRDQNVSSRFICYVIDCHRWKWYSHH